MTKQYSIRELCQEDYYKNFLQLLEQLTEVDHDKITYEKFCKRLSEKTSKTYVIEDDKTTKIIATATLLLEKKFIHKLGSVAHIEDVVIDENYRGKKLGKYIIDELIQITKREKCYKIILNCSEKNIGFYERCGFGKGDIQMVRYTINSRL